MAETRGTWSLSEAWAEKTAGEWSPIFKVFVPDSGATPPSVPYSDRGYTLGGRQGSMPAGAISSIEKLTFASGTFNVIPSQLPSPRMDEEGCSGPSKGISGAQYAPGSYTMCRLTLSNESITAMPSSTPLGHANPFGGNSTAAYGAAMHGTLKYTYSNDNFAQVPGASIGYPSGPSNWNQWGAGAQSAVAGTPNEGYWTWAKDESWFSKISYATDTGTTRVGTLLSSSYMGGGGSGAASSTDAYWLKGGNNYNNWPSPGLSVQVMPFSTLTCRLSPSTLYASGSYAARIPNGNTECYIIGGYHPGPTYTKTTVTKITYATETSAAHPSYLNTGRRDNGGYSPSGDGAISAAPYMRWMDSVGEGPDVGFISQGTTNPSNRRSSTDKVNMSTDLFSYVPSGNASHPGMGNGVSFGSATHGISATGRNYIPANTISYTNVDKFDYTTESYTSLSGFSGTSRGGGSGYTGPQGTTGWKCGGYTNPAGNSGVQIKNTDTFSFASDTFASAPSSNVVLNRAGEANAQDSKDAWRLGGYQAGGGVGNYGQPTNTSDTAVGEKMPFATGTWSMQPTSYLYFGYPDYWGSLNAPGDDTNAFVTEGGSGSTGVFKLTFATNTLASASNYLTPSPSNSVWRATAGISNQTKGYFAGGMNPGNTGIPNVCKQPYATETVTANPSGIYGGGYGCMSFGPNKTGARPLPDESTPTSKVTFGYGEKQGRYNNPVYDHGYIGGGQGTGSPGIRSSDDRLMKLALSTDTASEVPAGLGPNYRGMGKGLSSGQASAFFAGGQDPSANTSGMSYLRRIDYSNDTASLGEPMVSSRKNMISFGNEMLGFFALGRSGSDLSDVHRLFYNYYSSYWGWRTTDGQYPANPSGIWPGYGGKFPGDTRSLASTGGTPERAYIGAVNESSNTYSTAIRYTYVLDLQTTAPGTNYTSRERGTGNSTQTNWYIGGGNDGSNDLSSFDKMNFATETVGLLPGTNFTTTNINSAGVNAGNSHGYWSGISATVGNKVNYTTDTVSTTPIPSGSNPGKFASGTSMKDFGNSIVPLANLI